MFGVDRKQVEPEWDQSTSHFLHLVYLVCKARGTYATFRS